MIITKSIIRMLNWYCSNHPVLASLFLCLSGWFSLCFNVFVSSCSAQSLPFLALSPPPFHRHSYFSCALFGCSASLFPLCFYLSLPWLSLILISFSLRFLSGCSLAYVFYNPPRPYAHFTASTPKKRERNERNGPNFDRYWIGALFCFQIVFPSLSLLSLV